MGEIIINNLEVFAKHGVYKEENILGQKFYVCADIRTDFTRAYRNDLLDETINYGELCHEISDFMRENTFKLIETAAMKLCDMLILKHKLISGVTIEIKKPWAPIGLSLDYAGVKCERSWHTAYIATGSSLGDRREYLDNALKALYDDENINVIKSSEYLETEAYGGVAKEKFLNGCVEINTIYEPYELLDKLNQIEMENGRKRLVHWGDRTLDLDILLYDNLILHDEKLCIPHADMKNRYFVLKPLCDIAPYAYNPVLRLTAKEMLQILESNK